MRRRLVVMSSLLLILLTAACASHRGYRQAQISERQGDWDAAVLHYLTLVDQHPGTVQYRTGLLRAKIKASQSHFEKGKKLHQAMALETAFLEYREAIQLDPTNQYAQVEMEKVREALLAVREARNTAETLEDMKRRNAGKRPLPPILNPRSAEPIDLRFPNPVSIFDIYSALGKAFGINVQFDAKLRDQDVRIELYQVTAQEALEFLMRTAGHFYKVLNENTIIVAEDNAQNRRIYEDLVIQTFFLSNAEVKDQMTILRSLVGAKNIASNDQQNAIVLRDTADKVKVAERIIQTNDKARGEVIIEVELMQIDTSRLRELGISLSEYQIRQSLDPNPIPVSDLEFVNQANWALSIPSFIYDFVKTNSEAQLLANPHLRISDGEKAQLLIGDRVPIPVTSFNTSQTVGGNIVPITSFQYQDIGIRLDIEPRIHHNKEVSLKLLIEVSQITGTVGEGLQQPIIGTRTIESTIRLSDGETNFLAGLIRTGEQQSQSGIPGLADIPVLGRLFSKDRTEKTRTDLVLTLTPHIIRTPDVTEEDLLPIWVGTEANITFRGGSPRVESEVGGPFDEEDDSAERIREMIRRRIQNLPRGGGSGAQSGDEAEEEPPAEDRGQDLVPSGSPRDPFGRSRGDADENSGPSEVGAIDAEMEVESVERADNILWGPPTVAPRGAVPAVGVDSERETPVAVDDGSGLRGDVGLASRDGLGEATVSAGPISVTTAPPETAPRNEEPRAKSAAKEAGEVPSEAVRLRLTPAIVRVAPGESFEVVLHVDAGKPVSHVPVKLAFDPALLVVESVEEGGFLKRRGEAKVLADYSSPGRVVLGASRLGRLPGVKGTGVVARIRFRAKSEGATELRFTEAKALAPSLRPQKLLATAPVLIRVMTVPEGAPRELPDGELKPRLQEAESSSPDVRLADFRDDT